jgi:hypothetical protein
MSVKYLYIPNLLFPGRMSLLCFAADFLRVLIISRSGERSPVVKEASPAKDVSPVVATAKADAKKIKHYKPKVLARQQNNYGYGNALGYAEESGYGPRGLFFR